jgi:hypothetical protein
MRRVLAAAMLGAALFAAAACGSSNNDNDGGDDSGTQTASPTPGAATGNEETCAEINEAMADFQTDLATAGSELSTAAASGDETAIEEAAANLIGVAGETGDRLRDIAANSEDPELRTAVEDAATEVENLAESFAANPDSPESLDPTAFEDAAAAIEAHCGPA